MFYAWIGAKDGDKFDADKVDEQTASVSAKKAQASLKVTSTINKNADSTYDLDDQEADNQSEGPKVDLRAVSSVTFTAQLKDDLEGGGKDVARAGVSIRVEYNQGSSYRNTHEATLVTDDEGKVSFTVDGPADNRRVSGQTRADDVTFTELDSSGSPTARTGMGEVYWVEETPVLTDSSLTVADYVLAGSSVSVGAVVYLYDQYGNPHRPWAGQMANISIGEGDGSAADRQVISRGYARWSRRVAAEADSDVDVVYTVTAHSRNAAGHLLDTDGEVIDSDDNAEGVQGSTDVDEVDNEVQTYIQTDSTSDQTKMVPVVRKAHSQDDVDVVVTHVLDKDNKFLADANDDDAPSLVYSYDSDDVFINSTGDEGVEVSMDKFESTIDNNASGVANDISSGMQVTVTVLVYDVDGSSIFEITSTTAG